MPAATRAGPALGRRAPAPVVVHSAPLVLPICADAVRDGAVAVRGDRVLRVGTRAELLGFFRSCAEHRWPGVIVPGLVDACSDAPAPGVTTRAGVMTETTGPCDISYLPVSSETVEVWEERDRDALVTAIREVENAGIAAHSQDPQVLEEVAVLARTYGLRLLADLDAHSTAVLDETGVLGPHCHVTVTRPLDPGERKLLRLRATVAVLRRPLPEDVAALLEEGNLVALGGSGVLGVALAVRERAGGRVRGLDRLLVEAATRGGALALGRSAGPGRIGSLGPGSRADLAVFDADPGAPHETLVDGARCLATVVGGI